MLSDTGDASDDIFPIFKCRGQKKEKY